MDAEIYSVSEINNLIKTCFDSNPLFSHVCILGEISNYKLYPSGHHYFSLKDKDSSLPCVMFKGNAYGLKFKPESGMSVLALGRISSYPRDGKYQLYCDALEVFGAGDLQIAFEQLKEKLSKEGLFDSSHKKKLPVFPKRICVITSSAGAAVHDIIRVTKERWPLSKIILIPVRVQGEEAPDEIVEAISFANEKKAGDVIITGRGGGSLEDLWAFNDEKVARAIYDSEIPVISAVGHEPDVTISDYVADKRAATPSNAAEIAVPDVNEIRGILEGYKLRLNPETYINNQRMDLDRIRDRLISLIDGKLSLDKQHFLKAASSLDAMSPLKVLSRGYCVATKDTNTVVNAMDLSSGDVINIMFSEGNADCKVEKVNA